MIKVAMIGAGSVVFSKNLTGDILSHPEFKNATLTFGLPFDRLPADQHPTSLQLFGSGATLPADETLVASILVGDQLAGVVD